MKKFLLASLLTILFCLPFTNLSAQYISSTTTQATIAPIYPGQTKQMILRIEVEIGSNPVTLTNMIFNSNGSSNPVNDITKAQLWQYNDSIALDTTLGILIGTFNLISLGNFAMLMPSAYYVGMSSFSGMTPSQKNYLWLTIDISPNATLCNYVDADFVYLYADGIIKIPSVSSPSGYRVISPCATGLDENLLKNVVTVFPVPCQDELTISIDYNENENITFDLYNVTGTKVATLYDGIVYDSFSEIKFSLAKFPPGIYYLNCISNSGVVVKRIVKV